jgi:hypothetical protein
MYRSRRFGGNLFCQLPLGLTCVHGFKMYGNAESLTFTHRRARLIEVAKVLTQQVFDVVQADNKPVVQFVPAVPQVSVVHIHVHVPVEVAIAARDHAVATTGRTTIDMWPSC